MFGARPHSGLDFGLDNATRTVGVWSVAKRSLREACERIGRPRATAAQNGRDVEGQRALPRKRLSAITAGCGSLERTLRRGRVPALRRGVLRSKAGDAK